MKINVYAVYDIKAEVYMQPMFLNADGLAVRSFVQAMENPETPLSKYPQDFILFKIGQYDDNTAKIESHEPLSLGNGVELLASLRREQERTKNEISNDTSVQPST